MKRWVIASIAVLILVTALFVGCGGGQNGSDTSPQAIVGNMVVFGFSELGMHCMNKNFSKLMVLPPYSTVRAQVIQRGGEPQIINRGVVVSYSVPGNTHSTGKTNFWSYAQRLFNFAIAPNRGLTGTRLVGNMRSLGDGRFEATGIPMTPQPDSGPENPYQLANIKVTQNTVVQATTQAVVPVSWEIRCNYCHNSPEGADTDILRKHDAQHNTALAGQTPVACGRCHTQPPLATALPGSPALPTLSRAMHNSHASRMAGLGLSVNCYACHPGVKTQCQRDIHKSNGMTCASCHGSMTAVASPSRTPWVDEPRCGSCHSRAGFAFEEPGKLFKDSRGHNGVYCTSCHNTPHAIVPTTTAADNVQNIALQGHAGTIDTCNLCHKTTPNESFNHTLSD